MHKLHLHNPWGTVYYEWIRDLTPVAQVKDTYLSVWNVGYGERGDTFLV